MARLRVPEFIRQRVLERRPTLSVCALTVDRYPIVVIIGALVLFLWSERLRLILTKRIGLRYA